MPNPSLGCFLLVRCCLSCLFFFAFLGGGRCQIPRLGCFLLVGCCLSCLGSFVALFWGADAKSLAWVFFARRVLPFVLGFFCCLFLGGDAKSLAWVFFARAGAAFRVGVLFWPFLGAMPNPSLGCFLLVGVLTKWMVMGSVYLELFETKPCCILVCPIIPYVRAMEHHFVVQKCPKSVKISPSSQVLPCLFWGRCQIPRLGVSCSSGAAFRAWVFFVAFFGGDAKSLAWVFLAWVFLARRVLPFVLGFFFGLFWGRCQIPRLGVSCSSGAY